MIPLPALAAAAIPFVTVCPAGLACDPTPPPGMFTCYNPVQSDGDTIRDCDGRKVRLYGLDAAEIRHGNAPAEPFSYEAQDRLRELTRGYVSCIPAGNKHDRYRRVVARCSGLTPDVGETLVREGLAWRYDKFDRAGVYRDAERDAQGHRRGLWKGSVGFRPEGRAPSPSDGQQLRTGGPK